MSVGGLAAALCLPQVCAKAAAKDGDAHVGRFTFDAWGGPPLQVYFVEPASAQQDAPIVIVMHGAGRNADDYRDNWIDLAKQYGFVVYAPEFDRKHFPQARHYNMGGLTGEKPRAFDAIDPLFDMIKKRRTSGPDKYILFGHSAGAQFVHRFVFFRPKARYKMAIAANAGWYTLTRKDQNWPYGLGKLKKRRYNMKKAFQKPLVILLGAKDNVRNDKNLRTTPKAMAQGPHRLARGVYFLKTAKASAEASRVALKWRFQIIPGVGHDNRGMAIAAAALIAQDQN